MLELPEGSRCVPSSLSPHTCPGRCPTRIGGAPARPGDWLPFSLGAVSCPHPSKRDCERSSPVGSQEDQWDEDAERGATHYASGGSKRAWHHHTHPRALETRAAGGTRSCSGPSSTRATGPSITPQAHVHFLKLLPHAFGKILTLLGAGVPEQASRDPRVRPFTVQLWCRGPARASCSADLRP